MRTLIGWWRVPWTKMPNEREAMKESMKRAAAVMSKQQAAMEKTGNRTRLAGPVWR